MSENGLTETAGNEPMAAACRAMLQHVAAYLDGELAATECRRIEAHCEQCPDCRALVDGLRDAVGLCREAGSVPLPESVRARALAGVRRLLADSGGSGA